MKKLPFDDVINIYHYYLTKKRVSGQLIHRRIDFYLGETGLLIATYITKDGIMVDHESYDEWVKGRE